jgi:ABC-type uncharacterized transport system ATPase subunit
MKAISVEGLTKTFRTKVKPEGLRSALRSLVRPEWREVEAVRGIDLSIDEGEIVAFLGPNGAGKSTTIKTLTGILQPTAGSARVLGLVFAAVFSAAESLAFVPLAVWKALDWRLPPLLLVLGIVYMCGSYALFKAGLRRYESGNRMGTRT